MNQTPRPSLFLEPTAPQGASKMKWIFGVSLALFAIAFATHARAQQTYPGSQYGPNGSAYQGGQDQGGQYAPQYAQPAPQNGYTQPQYAPPQDQQPQYQPQYSAPQQPYADQGPNDAQGPYAQPDESPAPAQALSAEDLEQLLAPIALYPDSLLAQVLAASTYPAQVAVADQWLQQMRAQGYGSADQIAAGANAQGNWDPSIKALTAFPDVLDMMNHDLEWTANLGNAYYNQPQDVMQTVQVLRDRAEQAGNLQSTPQEEVNNDQGYVELEPTNPEVVYVPTYNPWDVYGEPIAPYPGFAFFGGLGDFYGDAPIEYGLGFALGAFDRMPFGWSAWGCDWAEQGLMFNHSGYYSHSRQVADWGLPRGGPRSYFGRGGNGGMRDGQNRSRDSQNRSYDQRPGYNHGGGNQRGGWPDNSGGRGGSNGRGGGSDRGGRGGDQSYVRPAQGFPEPGRLDYSNRGYSNRGSQQPGNGYARPAMPGQQMYNRPGQQPYQRVAPQQNNGYRPQTDPNRTQMYTNPGYSGRPQSYSNPGYANGDTGRSNYGASAPQAYSSRPGFAYSNPSNSYRAPQTNNSRGFQPFSGGQSRSFGSGRAPSYSNNAPRSFGGGRQSFGGGGQSFGGGRQSFGGGGQSFGGGHQSFGGGGQSFGGGHQSFGGGHQSFGGGHQSFGGGGGGNHHR
jgi:hypothetical protein